MYICTIKTKILNLSSKDLRGRSGIYILHCKTRSYVGSSKSLYDRLLEHRERLFGNKHSNDFLQKAFNKYGVNEFEYQILEYCNPENRIEREKYYIDPKYLGKHFTFYCNNEVAFNSVKDAWKFFSNKIINGETHFNIEIKLKPTRSPLNSVNCWKTRQGNQQPSLNSNILEGSTTNSQIPPSNVEDGNADTSAEHCIAKQ